LAKEILYSNIKNALLKVELKLPNWRLPSLRSSKKAKEGHP
jgi:hypothetical protein